MIAAPHLLPQRGVHKSFDDCWTCLSIFKAEKLYKSNKQNKYKMPSPNTYSSEEPADLNIDPNPATDPSSSSAANTSQNPTTQTKTPAEEEADRLYEERIEEEYAKREGGA